MLRQINIEELRKSIFFRTISILTIISIFLILTITIPLTNELTEKNNNEVHFIVDAKSVSINQFLSTITNVAEQFTSRTQIRKKLEAYNQGKVTKKELYTFSHNKLLDAMKKSKDAYGITRLDAKGEIAVVVGQQVPNSFLESFNTNINKTTLFNPIMINDKLSIIIATPILNRKKQKVGIDIVLFYTDSLKSIVHNYNGMGKTGEIILTYSKDGSKYNSFFETRSQTDFNAISTMINDFKKELLTTKDIEHNSCNKCIATIREINNCDWYLVFRIDKDELTSLIYENTIRLIIIAGIIIVVGLVGVYILTSPLMRKLEDDVFEIEKAKHETEIQKKEFETIFLHAKDAIGIVNLEGDFLKVNDAFVELTGYSEPELLKLNCNDLTAPKDREKNIKAMDEAVSTGTLLNFEKECIVADERKVDVNLSMSLLPDKPCLLLIVRDITRLKQLEEQSKLISMGEMIGNIAHQWRQPLSVITTASTSVLFYKEQGALNDDFLEKEMNNINEQAQYLSKTIDDFRNFIQDDQLEQAIKITEAIKYALHLTEASLKNNYINIILNLNDEIEINGSKNELVQSFINIINNSKDALKENTQEEDRHIFISSNKKGENELEVTISDSGGGIPDDVIERIFEPYFTTKHQNVGTGIGLTMVNKILRDKYQADIKVSNQTTNYNDKEYFGACFMITFKSDDKIS